MQFVARSKGNCPDALRQGPLPRKMAEPRESLEIRAAHHPVPGRGTRHARPGGTRGHHDCRVVRTLPAQSRRAALPEERRADERAGELQTDHSVPAPALRGAPCPAVLTAQTQGVPQPAHCGWSVPDQRDEVFRPHLPDHRLRGRERADPGRGPPRPQGRSTAASGPERCPRNRADRSS